jgi:Domain of unknown function (DUF1707)
MDDSSIRVSDADRDEAVAVLREHLLAGRLTLDVTGLTIFGHRRDWGKDPDRPDAPAVRIHVIGFVGTVDVWRVPHDLHAASYSDIIHRLHDRRRELPA